MKATNIQWDIDLEEGETYEEMKLELGLPDEMELPEGMTDEEEISDYLSEVTGYCHEGFTLEHEIVEQLENATAIEYKGILFDEWTIDEETGGIYGEMCECCAEKYKDILSEELSDGGMGACSVKGCDVVGMDADTNSHYYVDFKPELIRVHEMRQEKEMENDKGLDSKILNAKEMQKEASAGKGDMEALKEATMRR